LLIISLALFTAYLGRLKVVVSPTTNKAGTLTRFVVELTYKRKLLEIALDFFLIGAAYYLSFFTINGLKMNDASLQEFLYTLPIALSCAYVSFFLFGVYRGVWKYIGTDDLLNFVKVVLLSVASLAVAIGFIDSNNDFTPVIFILYGIFLFLGLIATRSSFKVLDQISSRRSRQQEHRIIILGAGDAGEMAVRWIQMNPDLCYRPVGFLDKDILNKGRLIHGVEILGGYNLLNTIIDQKQIDGVIITESDINADELIQEIIPVCRERKCWIRSLKLEFELIE
jgi:UDP-GlcNAc:undecaprenyl-phosphate GlcNAc-1-phosphate transferase